MRKGIPEDAKGSSFDQGKMYFLLSMQSDKAFADRKRQKRGIDMEQKVRIFEAFAGYGSQSLALERLCENFPEFGYEVVGISEIDKYAVQAYNAIHGEIKNWGDVTAIDWHLVPDFDLLTWSSPCQDISVAGKGKGMTEGSGTRSSLLWEVNKPIEIKRPKYILFENVKNFIGENNRADALRLFSMLEGYGYTVFFKVINAKDYGVPQNRERIFILAIDGDASYEFPEGFLLERRLKDVLEENVDERYYLSGKAVKQIIGKCGKKKIEKQKICQDSTICLNSKVNGKQPSVSGRIYDVNGIMTAITTGFMPKIAEPKVIQIGNIIEDKGFKNPQRGRVYAVNGISPTIDIMGGGNREPKILEYSRIRKLTPRECFRLMDMDDKYIDRIQEAGISNSQQYKLAGNSIVVACLYWIFKNLFIGYEKTTLFHIWSKRYMI